MGGRLRAGRALRGMGTRVGVQDHGRWAVGGGPSGPGQDSCRGRALPCCGPDVLLSPLPCRRGVLLLPSALAAAALHGPPPRPRLPPRLAFSKINHVWPVWGPCIEFLHTSKYGIGHKSQKKQLKPYNSTVTCSFDEEERPSAAAVF